LLHQEHSLTIKQFIKAVIPEENVLSTVVPKSILVYKAKITAIAYQNLCEKLTKVQGVNDKEQQDNILKQLQILMHIRNSFAKELHRLTI